MPGTGICDLNKHKGCGNETFSKFWVKDDEWLRTSATTKRWQKSLFPACTNFKYEKNSRGWDIRIRGQAYDIQRYSVKFETLLCLVYASCRLAIASIV